MLVGLRARGRHMEGPNLKIRRGLVASVNTSHLSKENRIAKCLKWVTQEPGSHSKLIGSN